MVIDKQFSYEPISEGKRAGMSWLRTSAKELALQIDASQPDSREKSLAITKLEEAIFWANAGIARNPSE